MAQDKPRFGPPIERTPPIRVPATIPRHIVDAMDDYGRDVGLSRGAVIRIALAEFLRDRERIV